MTASTDNPVLEASRVTVGAGERLNRSFVIGAGMSGPRSVHVSMGADSSLDLSVIILPGADCEVELDVDMEGPGAEAYISGIYLCPGNETVRIATYVNHKVHHCTSRQLFKGIAGGTARTDFFGKIVVSPDAQKTEAYQENHNLLLSEDAKVETDPQLEIYADDVKCSHGAAIGKLDENEQFYMRSRGIPEQEAKVLQMQSFVSPVFEFLPECGEREKIAAWIEHTIRDSF